MSVRRFQKETIAALAGRRIDAPNAKVTQFPLAMIPIVKRRLSEMLLKEGVSILICSAACGADLLALDAAFEMGIRCRIILPFEQNHFRQSSVEDRPGNWGPIFDRLVSLVDSNGDLTVLCNDESPKLAYRRANEIIIQEAASPGASRRIAILVWEGRPRLQDDATAEFQRLANAAGMSERAVSTL